MATPGRLLDLVETEMPQLRQACRALVLDEADRMLDMGFVPDVTRIINLLPKQRQSLLFSATFSEEIKKLADKMLKVADADRSRQAQHGGGHHHAPGSIRWRPTPRRALLVKLLRSSEFNQVLVFTRTKIETNKLARDLQRAGIAADSIHGDKSQLDRLKALEAFKNGTVLVLVATDVAARGLDIDDLPHVINFELPHTPEDYIHRIGRTGRAGKQGTAISLVAAHEVQYLVDIEKLIKIQVEQVIVPGFDPEYDYEYPPQRAKRSPPPSTGTVVVSRTRPPDRAVNIPRPAVSPAAGARATSPPTVLISANRTKVQARTRWPHPPITIRHRSWHTWNTRTKPRRLVAALLGGLGPEIKADARQESGAPRFQPKAGLRSADSSFRRNVNEFQDRHRDIVAIALRARARPADQKF